MNTPVLPVRLRRLRQNANLRGLVAETSLSVADLVCPLFITTHSGRKPIKSMPGCEQLGLDVLLQEIDSLVNLGIPAVLLFGIPASKDETGSDALSSNGVIAKATALIKKHAPQLLVITDLCFCEYTSHGHCGVVAENHQGVMDVNNDATLELLVKQALVQAEAGADVVAPSGMMDGMVAKIRAGLDSAGFHTLPILSYAVKYASNFYGPFREAAEGAPQFGDRKTYQMNPANKSEALREAKMDVQEGADMLMVKPAMSYLDIICRVKQQFPSMPLCAYQVSGEYAMIKAASQNGWLDEDKVMLESLLSIKRAGADFIITYFAKQAAGLLAG